MTKKDITKEDNIKPVKAAKSRVNDSPYINRRRYSTLEVFLEICNYLDEDKKSEESKS